MGREAVCKCVWAGTAAEVKALLESAEVILRGGIRKRIPFNEIKQVKALSDRLRFVVAGDTVELFLPSKTAANWASAITGPPPSLARKLGITSTTIVRTIGDISDRALNSALAEAAEISGKDAALIVAYVDSPESLHQALNQARAQLEKAVSIWMVFAKGKGHDLDESAIRSLFRANGMMDTKVASVSATLTALRFNLQKPG
jgi:hypothetical protein